MWGRVLISGGAGMIGSTIADLVVREGADEVVVVDDLSRGREANLEWARVHGPVRFVRGDIRDRDLVARLVDGVDYVFHQAGLRITQAVAEPRLALETLVDGTFNLVEAAAATGVRKFVTASTASVYGQAQSFPTQEDHHPYDNRTLYGAAKLFNEGILRAFHDTSGLDYVALRYFNVYGPRMDVHGVYTEVLVRWMERIAAGEPPLIAGDGSATMDFVFVEDVARANLLAARSDVSDVVCNIATGTETSLQQLADALLRAMASDLVPEHIPESKINPVARRLADTSKARDLLGFEAAVDLDEGLRRLVQWWRGEREPANAASTEALQ